MRYAIIETSTGHIINIIIWDGKTEYTLPDGYTMRPAKDDESRWIDPNG